MKIFARSFFVVVQLAFTQKATAINVVRTSDSIVKIEDLAISTLIESHDSENVFFSPIKTLYSNVDTIVKIKTKRHEIDLGARQKLRVVEGWKSAIDLSLSEQVMTKKGWEAIKHVSIEKAGEYVDVRLKDAHGYYVNEFLVLGKFVR